MSAHRDQEFTDYVTATMGSLRRLAYLLCQDPSRVDPGWQPQTFARSKRDPGVTSEVPSDLAKLLVGWRDVNPRPLRPERRTRCRPWSVNAR